MPHVRAASPLARRRGGPRYGGLGIRVAHKGAHGGMQAGELLGSELYLRPVVRHAALVAQLPILLLGNIYIYMNRSRCNDAMHHASHDTVHRVTHDTRPRGAPASDAR